MNNLNYQLIRSNRKTLGLEIKETGLVVRVPFRTTDRQITEFIKNHETWIETHLQRQAERQKKTASLPKFTKSELQQLADQALQYIPQRVAYFAPKVGVTYGSITIRNQKTRWGSCSSRGNLNFNCLLMLTPPEVIDSVVVHELCHRKEMNHSERFYTEVLRVFPDYWKWHQWLKENGKLLISRMA